jgi:sugar lactone lactonase YvrE
MNGRVASLAGAPAPSVVIAMGAIALLLLAVAPSAFASIRFAQKWGTQGSGGGQFQAPQGIATGSAGNVYVSDSTQIKRFSSSGGFLGSWGTEGTGDGQFNGAGAIATDSSGHVYVADLGNGRIEKFSPSGAFLGQWGSPGSGDGQFTDVGGIATDSAGNVFVSDVSDNRIQEFDPSGGFIAKWGTEGSGDGELSGPEGIAIDDSDHLYVVDYFNSRIEKLSTAGTYLGQWGSQGSADGQFQSPLGIATDPAGNVYVADYTGNTIQKFDPSGGFLARWGSEGTGDGQFDGPIGIAVDASSNVYVVEAGNYRVQKFRFSASPPATAITSGPSGTTYQPSPTFRFSSPDLDTTFACRIDSRPYVPCGSASPPRSYTSPHLADGPHTFSVRAMDSAGKVDPTPATRSFIVRTASVDISGSALVVTAAPGAKDNLRFGWRLDDYPLTVTNFPRSPGYGSGLDAGAGCTQSGQYMAFCGFGVTRIRVRAGDRNDLVINATGIPNRNNTGPIPSTLDGEAGADTLTGGPLRDTLIGGPGADVMRGMGANDQLDARDLTSDRWIDCDGGSNPGSGDVATLDLLPKDGNFIVKGCEFKRRGR